MVWIGGTVGNGGNGGAGAQVQTKSCTEVTIGNSGSNTKSAALDSTYRCPSNVDKSNWINGGGHQDRFQITQSGNQVTARRLDYGGGWGMHLRFECCTNGNNRPVQPSKPQGCSVAHIGNSGSNTKSASLDSAYRCPSNVDKGNWVDGGSWGDRFQITQSGNQVTARRLDYGGGWGMDLKFKCCTTGSTAEEYQVIGIAPNAITIFAVIGALTMMYYGLKGVHKMVFATNDFLEINQEETEC